MADVDYYILLGVERAADDKLIKAAYRKLAMQYHPDKNPGCAESEAKFKAISEAYDCLKDPQKRAAYDRYGKAAFQQGGMGGGGGGAGFDQFSDIFDNIFGEFVGGGRQRGGGRSGALRGNDLRYDLELSLEEAFAGKSITINIDVSVSCTPCSGTGAAAGSKPSTCSTCHGHGKVRMQQGFFVVERTCPTCHGAGQMIKEPCGECQGHGRVDKPKSLQVNVPAGVDDGTRIRLSGEGEAGVRGGPAGDLYIFIHLKTHAVFQREATTLFASVPISITTAALGGEIEVPGIDRKKVSLKIPAGTQSAREFRIRGRGMPSLNGTGFGDMVISVDVETPTKMSPRQKELLEEFRAIEGEVGSSPKSNSFFTKLKDVWDELTD